MTGWQSRPITLSRLQWIISRISRITCQPVITPRPAVPVSVCVRGRHEITGVDITENTEQVWESARPARTLRLITTRFSDKIFVRSSELEQWFPPFSLFPVISPSPSLQSSHLRMGWAHSRMSIGELCPLNMALCCEWLWFWGVADEADPTVCPACLVSEILRRPESHHTRSAWEGSVTLSVTGTHSRPALHPSFTTGKSGGGRQSARKQRSFGGLVLWGPP